MFRTPVALVGLAGIFFIAGSFVPGAFSTSPQAQSQALPLSASAKGDRVAGPVQASNLATVSTVELIGISQATVILRDRDGMVLYKSDPQSGVTTYARNTDLPVVTLKEETRAPAQHPVSRQEGNEAPREPKQKSRNPIGCVGDVSPLAKASANRMPSLCLALLEQSLT
jgi:hypothetical protein